MINYHVNELIDECLGRYYQTFAVTLDTADFVPVECNLMIFSYILKKLRKQFKKIDKEDRKYQRQLAAELKRQRRGANTHE